MYKNSIKSKIICNLSQIPGWRTNRKIIVIESDDWGSVRVHNREAFLGMQAVGLDVSKTHYDTVDALESNEDLQDLFSILSDIKDKSGNHPVFTPMCIMGNPDFDKIAASNFEEYYFQPLEETLNEYPKHDKVLDMWKKGIEEKLFSPALHGREHINVVRYLRILQTGDEGMRTAFSHKSVGASSFKGKSYPNYLGALFPESKDEVKQLHLYLKEAGTLFEKYCGYKPLAFIAPNAEEPKELEATLNDIGVKYLTRSKNRLYPLGDGSFKRELNWLGKQNSLGQICIVRNCFFEPVAWGEHSYVKDWIGNCLKEIEIAFRWKKPALISTHRVNYVGFIDPANRDKGIKSLRLLIKSIQNLWPDVEFLSTNELGQLIESERSSLLTNTL